MHKLCVICGPTATGKTALAVALAKKLSGELVSADSRQVYREMDIGTGKDRGAIGDVPIWMYDVAAPDEEFSVSQYATMARAAIADIVKRGHLPIVVGGTGFYINALLHPFQTINIPPDNRLRAELADLTVSQLQQKTTRGGMNESDWNNPRRLIRKIEITAAGDERGHEKGAEFDACLIGLTAPMHTLDKRIGERVDERLRQGMADEVTTLVKKYGRDIPAMSALGYRSTERWAKDERAYARRQMTWFRKVPGITWFDITKKGYEAEVTRHVFAWYTGHNV